MFNFTKCKQKSQKNKKFAKKLQKSWHRAAQAIAGGALQSKESRLESLLSKSPICGPLSQLSDDNLFDGRTPAADIEAGCEVALDAHALQVEVFGLRVAVGREIAHAF